ncbi:response regulator transcription factor [Schaalia canis]|uniref:Sensory transduction protein RegX3 n=1 Tax=Schaalia canis TaxID=100469 RepID=A0A3P1SB80_9ACTO|nr:response regulator transcription factor [Schaalia canis]RRC94513.1 DNA-binding response regulator [Schaalia canis]
MTDILIIEDEDTYREALAFALERDGYTVTEAADGQSGLTQALSGRFDLILLDLMLPGISGMDICATIRRHHNTPIIMVTAKDDVADRIVGLENGADDYITKPYSYRELLARVRAVMRRREPSSSDDGDEVLEVGALRLSVERHEVSVNGQVVSMPLREFELLACLARNAGRVLTRSQLMERVWGTEDFHDSKTLDVHVKRLRSKIERDPSAPQRLVTVRGVGYKLVAL